MRKLLPSLGLAFVALGCPSEKAAPEAPATKTEPPPAAKAPPPAAPAEPAAPAAPAEPPQAALQGGGPGKITGVVSLRGGAAPAPAPLDMSADPKCKSMSKGATSDDVKVAGGKVQDVFVYLKAGYDKAQKHAPPETKAIVDQKSCMYTPKVQGVMVGQPVEIVNSDPLLHNIHGMGKEEFNRAMPTQNQRIEMKFKKVDVMHKLKCDVHPWMTAWVGVLDHPFFAVSDQAGGFTIENVPPGKYTIEAWHSKLGVQALEIEVAPGGTANALFELSGS